VGGSPVCHATELQLKRLLRTSRTYSCADAEGDATIALKNVDYLCKPVGHPQLQWYWVSTNGTRITGTQPTG
jgi:hypothetical protein